MIEVLNSAKCRYEGRFPVLSFVHKYSGNLLWRAGELRADLKENHSQIN